MINLFAGLALLSVVVALGAAVVPDYFNGWDRLKAGLLTLLVMWLVFAGMSSFWLVGWLLGGCWLGCDSVWAGAGLGASLRALVMQGAFPCRGSTCSKEGT